MEDSRISVESGPTLTRVLFWRTGPIDVGEVSVTERRAAAPTYSILTPVSLTTFPHFT